MSQYYYAVAALPFLLFDQEKVDDLEEFVDFCRRQMSDEDFSVFAAAKIDDFPEPPIKDPFLDKWQNWEMALRNELVALRAQKLGMDPKDIVPAENIPEARNIAQEAFSQESPLQAEMHLLHARWDFLDEMEVGHFFDLEKLLIYYLKLQLLKRKSMFNKEYGRERFNETYEKIENKTYIREPAGE